MNKNRYGKNMFAIRDRGAEPIAVNTDRAAKVNPFFRTALWTGDHLQVTLMSIPVGGDIGLEMHPDHDQFLRIESGFAHVMMGRDKNCRDMRRNVNRDFAVIVPAGAWHNIVNIGKVPLKIYSVYAPPKHPFGTVHRTKAEAEKAEGH